MTREELLKIKKKEKEIDDKYRAFWDDNKSSTVTLNKRILDYARSEAKKQDITLKDYLEYLILEEK